MRHKHIRWLILAGLAAGWFSGPAAQEARADDLGPILLRTLREFGLGVTLTDRSGTFQGGFEARADAFYNNQEFYFGMASLRLNGPLSMQFQTSDRLGPSAEFRVSTINPATGLPQPLTYNLDINTGLQDLNFSGAVNIQANTEINILGFYDTQIFVSNRGDFEADGFLLTDSGTLDFDVGPIDVSGNVFADALALLTDPFFASAGIENPFAKFSGRATRDRQVVEKVSRVEDKVKAGLELTDQDLANLIDSTVLAAIFGLDAPDLGFLSQANLDALEMVEQSSSAALKSLGGSAGLGAVPEPTSLTLVAAGLLLARRRRRQQRHT